MTPIAGVAVVVPAHDEERLLPGCLAAVAVARHRLAERRPGVRISVTVVLDDCHDGTAGVVERAAGVDAVVVDRSCVGAARAAGSDHGIRELGRPGSVWTAHTDADSRVPPDWLVSMLELADAGADAVLGTIELGADATPRLRAAWSTLNPACADHPYVHGANLGVRASALGAVGGWRPLVTDEDVDLVDRLRGAPDVTLVTTTAVPVVTSAREHGRAPAGLSKYLSGLTVA